jgi:hypothetical protein
MYLCEEVHGWKKAEQPQVCVNDGNNGKLLPRLDLHNTVIRPVNGQVKEEDCQEVVGCARSSRDAEIKAKYYVDESNK